MSPFDPSPEEARKQVQARIKLEKQKVAERGFQNPVESFPPELLLFFRALNLTRGVLSTLDVKVPFIKLLAGWARKALVDKLQPQAKAKEAAKQSSESTTPDSSEIP